MKVFRKILEGVDIPNRGLECYTHTYQIVSLSLPIMADLMKTSYSPSEKKFATALYMHWFFSFMIFLNNSDTKKVKSLDHLKTVSILFKAIYIPLMRGIRPSAMLLSFYDFFLLSFLILTILIVSSVRCLRALIVIMYICMHVGM